MADKHTSKMTAKHRERARANAARRGFDELTPAALLEIYLFGLLPRIDTYPAAHRLIERFGSVEGVFSATKEELLEVYGIGEKSAERIVTTGAMIDRTLLERFTRFPLDSDIHSFPAVFWICRKAKTDGKLLIALDKDRMYMSHRLFAPEEGERAISKFLEASAKSGAVHFIFAHRHPEGYRKPTPEDIAATGKLSAMCEELGAKLDEHYIVTDTDGIAIIGKKTSERRERSEKRK